MSEEKKHETAAGQRKPCRNCLFQDITEDKIRETIRGYVERIDPEIKTPKEQYIERLDCCRRCEKLLQGTCQVCGCFVEVRAAVTRHHCPKVHPEW